MTELEFGHWIYLQTVTLRQGHVRQLTAFGTGLTHTVAQRSAPGKGGLD